MKFIRRFFLIFLAYLFLFYPYSGFADAKVFIASGTYTIDSLETSAVAEERAALQAKRFIMAEATIYIARYLEKQDIKLTNDQIQALSSFALQYEILDSKKNNVDDGIRYDMKM